ncbi:hemerythrin HHE cation binding domain-containing protein [Colletotrichum cuscutae]|uniref:Hemerythrin HHE cation binding domain-containing protein n=1 Tax=Colletotrichum cuscutae TaxID=1209917 RepID=A0AAI9VEC1_9PEZI|nr:hemerythrin HHE cation binding domain-containing protein [Colletotrichum cuscutae]
MSSKKPWADRPFELISSTRAGTKKGVKTAGVNRMAEEMTVIHNLILRIINTVYLQCINVEKSPNDVQDFVSYAIEWSKMVEEHHETEETEVFPDIEQLAGVPGLMRANVAQHEAFHDGLHAGGKLKSIIDSFMPVLREHLSDEIDSLLKLNEYDRNWDEWYEKLMKKLLGRMGDPKLKVSTLLHHL